MYELTLMVAGNSVIAISNLSCTSFSTAVSSSAVIKLMARPFVPKRPARPTYLDLTLCKYELLAFSSLASPGRVILTGMS